MSHPRTAPPSLIGPGSELGDFVLGQPIAEGALGVLYAGVRRRDEAPVAVRVVPAERIRDDAAWRTFLESAAKAWQEERRHVAPVLGHGRLEDGTGWLASSLAEGRTLAQLLAEHPLEPSEVLAVLRGICKALEAAHRREIFHGELTTASVCIGSDAEGRMRARVLELGGAQLLDEAKRRSGPVTRAGVAYPPFDVSRDLRALGALTFEALVGAPFEGEVNDDHPRVSDARPELGAHFDTPVHALLVPGDQPESAAAAHGLMVEAARAAGYDVGAAIPLAPREASPSAPELSTRADDPSSGKPLALVLLAGLIAAVILATLWGLLR
ncbi:MAG: hypothetical protein FJ095_01455 [Deltaproteobacteria bacterium]|nr:hypothetical protein [Deltaproteobacteria bacterium]